MTKYKYTKNFFYNGKRYRVMGNTLEEVIEKKTKKLLDLEKNDILNDKSVLVSTWAQTVLDTYKINITDKTRKNNEYLLNKRILPFIGKMKVKDVKPIQCQQILNEMSGLSKDSISKTHQLLKLIFRAAQENKLIHDDPTLFLIKPEGTQNHRRNITSDERTHLEAVCFEDRRFVPYLFMLYCGCRPAEALKIVKDDIQKIDGISVLHIRGTKTKNSDRYVPIKTDFLKYIQNIGAYESGRYAERKNGDPHTSNSYASLTKALKRAMNISMGATVYRNELQEPLPLAKDFTPYCLRHTYCTDLKKAGVPLAIAKDYMGHSTISITADIYSHSDTDTLLAGAKILGITE